MQHNSAETPDLQALDGAPEQAPVPGPRGKHPETRRYEAFLRAVGTLDSTVKDNLSSVDRTLWAFAPDGDVAFFDALVAGEADATARWEGWTAAIEKASERQRVKSFVGKWGRYRADYGEGADRAAAFAQVNGGLSTLAVAAKAMGGVSQGTFGFRAGLKEAVATFGAGVTLDPKDPVMLLLADVPFSAFVFNGVSPDPAVAAAVSAVCDAVRDLESVGPDSGGSAPAVLLRVEWSMARSGRDVLVTVEDYLRVVNDVFARRRPAPTRKKARPLDSYSFEALVLDNAESVRMKGEELFILGTATSPEGVEKPLRGLRRRADAPFRDVIRPWTPVLPGDCLYDEEKVTTLRTQGAVEASRPQPSRGEPINPEKDAHVERILDSYLADPTVLASAPEGVRRLEPKEIAVLMGCSEGLTLPEDHAEAYRLLGSSVPVPTALRALRGMMRAVELV